MQFFELADNRTLGMDMFEVISIPNATSYSSKVEESCDKISNEFTLLLNEIHNLAGENTCFELLWITEKAQNQTFLSKIRIFCVERIIGTDKNQVEYKAAHIKGNLITSLNSLQYGISDAESVEEDLLKLLSIVDKECTYGVSKSERCISNMNSLYPYYYADIIANKNKNNFNALISSLSQSENACVSFQIFPISLSAEELFMISEVSGELGRIASGTMMNNVTYKDLMASEPAKFYSYYSERRNSPMFSYAIVVFGGKATCASLATKIIGLLQSGEEKIASIDPICLDLTNENIDLSKHFSFYPWNVNAKLIHYYRNRDYQNIPLAKNLYRLPYIISAEEATAFFRLPVYEKSMNSLRCNQIAQNVEQFSDAVVNLNNIQLGKLITADASEIMIGCSEKAFTKHALVVGTPGSGKTTFSVNILLQFARRGIPFLAIEPTKSEYRAMIEAIPELQIFTPGNNAVSPYIVNPFIPPKGIRVEQYIPSLASAFKAAFSMPSPLDMIFLKAIRTCYIQYGWKDNSKLGDEDVELFGLHEFIVVFKKLLENTSYSKEVKGNIESAGVLRLTNLIEQNSNIYDSINTVPIEDLVSRPTVLELNSIDNAEYKSLIMALLLINICIYTKHNQAGDGELKNVILIDEAHVLLGGGGSSKDGADSQNTTIKALQDMIAEIRSYGTSIIIADQSPTKVSREIVANTDIKVSFRLVQSVEKEMIADSTNMDEETKNELSRLKTGEAFVYYSKLETPQKVITEDIREKENIRLSVSDDEVAARSTYWDSHLSLLRPYKQCEYCSHCTETCDFSIRSNAEYISNAAFARYRKNVKSIEDYKKCVYHLPTFMKEEIARTNCVEVNRLIMCSRIKLLRKIALDTPFVLTEKEEKYIIETIPV